MTKILLISHIFPPAVDGGSRVIYKIGQYFKSQGNQILYLSSDCFSTDDFTKKFHCSKDLKNYRPNVLKIPVYHHLRRPLKFFNLFILPKSYLHQLIQVFQKGPIFKFIPFLQATIKIIKFKPDLIIAGPLPTAIILYAGFIQKITRSKLLVNASFHPTDPDFHRLPLIKTLQKADYIWTLTQYETDYFINKFKINPQKIILAGNGIDPNFLKKEIKKPRIQHLKSNILFIGSLSAHKGLDTLITTFSKLESDKSTSNISLTIAGQKTLYYPKIKNQISNLPKSVRSKIKFIFNFPQKSLPKLIENCDVLILPSKQESFGLVIIEAWARKKPVIVNNIPTLSEIISNAHGGLIFKTNNSTSLTQKISYLYQNPKIRHQLSQNGYNYVKNNYTWVKVGDKIKEKIFF